MSYSVGQIAGFTGVTVRTLHFYDRSGLLTPGERSPAGYRLYGDADLARLRRILFYRELGFPLEEIEAILDDPGDSVLDRLRERSRQLTEQVARLQRLITMAESAIEVRQAGVRLSPEERVEVFGDIEADLSYATDTDLKWGHLEGQRRSMARAAAHTKEDWRQLMAESAAWRRRLIAAFDEREPADGERSRALAEEHRQHIGRWFTPCSPETHRRIADDYVEDPRAFALVVPAAEQRPGLAGFLRAAAHANATHSNAARPRLRDAS
ncbi:MerR family transcriptional regulator [Streptomyces paludis]|uniref:MerR family transcriptional regulator n=1 Tax=Streptomyces paludis TaxID=2282738 RepID=A0A345HWK6_9ACTN|nr:MerR family transcriptional regulator [Streptomyces paludis]AXG81080.1 MerR family transcriptional regulator [Streptomyces paludis]